MNVRVVKIGGSALARPAWLAEFARHVARSESPLVVVHGGGPEISELSQRLGVAVCWSGGRRVTPPEALDVAAMVLSGRLNKRIVAALLDAGCDALGLSGEDGGLIRADLAEGGVLGRVGVVRLVRVELLRVLLSQGITPVVSPISRGMDGAAVNINADDVAAAVAAALACEELLFVTDVDGVESMGGVVPDLDAAQAAELIDRGVARGGMALKLEAALRAVGAGARVARIGSVESLVDETAGTRIRAAREVAA